MSCLVVLQVSNADEFVDESLGCVLRRPTRVLGINGTENPLNEAVANPHNEESMTWVMTRRSCVARTVNSRQYQLKLTKRHPPYPQ